MPRLYLLKKGMAKLSSRGGVVPHGAALTCTGCFIIGYRTIYTISTVQGTLATNKQTKCQHFLVDKISVIDKISVLLLLIIK